MDRCIEVYTNSEQLRTAAAEHWVTSAGAAINRNRSCHIALAGGSTPKMLYQLLATPAYRERVDWQQVHIYFGDERFVPHDHEQSNYRMARESFLDSLEIPSSQIHPIPYLEDADKAAAAYAETLRQYLPQQSGIPCFDLIWLGMGDDGHTASLFPGTGLVQESARICGAVYVDKMSSWRVSLTFPVINNAMNVFLLVNGVAKTARLAEVFSGEEKRYPVQSVAPHGNLYWLLDDSAAAAIDWNSLDAQWRVKR